MLQKKSTPEEKKQQYEKALDEFNSIYKSIDQNGQIDSTIDLSSELLVDVNSKCDLASSSPVTATQIIPRAEIPLTPASIKYTSKRKTMVDDVDSTVLTSPSPFQDGEEMVKRQMNTLWKESFDERDSKLRIPIPTVNKTEKKRQ